MRAVCPSGIPSLLAVLALGWVAPSSPPASAQPSAGALASDPLGDDWEENGIPFTDGAGGTRYYELPGADPDQKNLYVELDTMQGQTFPQASADAVVAAFAAAPLAPGGVGSIALVIDVDDADLPFETVTPSPADAFPANAASLKNTWFGTATERADPDAAALLAAKAKTFRYALLMNQSSPAIGGRAELPGDDMVLFAGGYDDIDKAAVFMHELGHNLNLGHGGSDGMNGKTNYPSIMNYLLAYREPRNATFWKLDYSREALALLDESAMNETVGIGIGSSGYYDYWFLPYYGAVAPDAYCFDPPFAPGDPIAAYAFLHRTIPTDFNVDCDQTDASVAVDVNFLPSAGLPGSVAPSPNELLSGFNDWLNVKLALTSGGGAFAGAPAPDELTDDQRAWMQENFPPPPTTIFVDGFDLGNDDAWSATAP